MRVDEYWKRRQDNQHMKIERLAEKIKQFIGKHRRPVK